MQPLIVEPIPFKEQLLIWQLQQQNVDLSYALLVQQWHDALQRIAEADDLIVLGYGFPPEDVHATFMFSYAAGGRNQGKKLTVRVFEKTRERFRAVRNNIENIFGIDRCCIEYCGKVDP